MAGDVLPEAVTLGKYFQSLRVSINDTGESMLIGGWFASAAQQVERIKFADGTIWNAEYIASLLPLLPPGNGDDLVDGTAADDLLDGLGGNDQILGRDGNDALIGDAGADYLDGGFGDDSLDGGIGNDTLNGQGGSDTYLFGRGSGQDTIFELGGGFDTDTIRLGISIAPADITLTRDYHHLYLSINGSADQLTVVNWVDLPDALIEQLEFSDGTLWSAAAVFVHSTLVEPAGSTFYGTDVAEILSDGDGSDLIYALAGDDKVTAGFGGDFIDGGAGNDVLTGGAGDDTLNGGAFSYGPDMDDADVLIGGSGDDTYLWQSDARNDTIVEDDVTAGNIDTVETDALPSDILLSRSGDDLLLSRSDYGSQLTVQNWFLDDAHKVEQIRFGNGITWDVGTILGVFTTISDGADFIAGGPGDDLFDALGGNDQVFGSGGNDTLRGGSGSDMLSGDAGNDTLDGGDEFDHVLGGAGNDHLAGGAGDDFLDGDSGDDLLDGSSGSDQLWGGGGNDTYLFGSGSGEDTIYEADGTPGNLDTLFVGALAADVTLTRDIYSLYLTINGSGDRMQVANWFGGASYQIERTIFSDGTEWSPAALDGIVTVTLASSGNDAIYGTSSGDTINGRGGNDVVYGLDGNDVIEGEDGSDQLYGGAGNDRLDGGLGSDLLEGSTGDDIYVFGRGAGTDTIIDFDMSPGNKDAVQISGDIAPSELTVNRNYHDLVLSITGADDTLTLRNWFDDPAYQVEEVRFAGGTVWDVSYLLDTVSAATDGADFLVGASGDDSIDGRGGSDTLDGRDGDDDLDGGPGSDTLYGGAGNDTLDGGAGDDVLSGESGADVIRFGVGSGHDRVADDYSAYVIRIGPGIAPTGLRILDESGGGISLNVAGYGDRLDLSGWTYSNNGITAVEFGDGTIWNSETLKSHALERTSAGNDRVHGTPFNDVIDGGDGSDVIEGGEGNDTLFGGPGNDYLEGGSGDDVIDTGLGSVNTVFGGDGNDLIIISSESNSHSTIDGGTGDDVYQIPFEAGTVTLTDAEGVDRVIFGDGVDPASLIVKTVRNANGYRMNIDYSGSWVNAFSSNYLSLTGKLSDEIESFEFSNGTMLSMYDLWSMFPTSFEGSEFDDAIIGTQGPDIANGGESNDVIFGHGGRDNLTGNEGDDEIHGGSQDDIIDGSEGSDLLFGDDGNDRLISGIGVGIDVLEGGAGDDTLLGTGAHYPTGNPGSYAVLRGGTGNDDLRAEGSNDVLEGGSGDDYLSGGFGKDRYIFGYGYGHDVLIDLDDEPGLLVPHVTNIIEMAPGVLSADVILGGSRPFPNSAITLLLGLRGGNELLEIPGWFSERSDLPKLANSTLSVNAVHFANGEVWDETELAYRFSIANHHGTEGDDELIGLSGNDVLSGGDGDDDLEGNGGDDLLFGGNGSDVVLGGGGVDSLRGGKSNDTLKGGEGDDVLDGGAGDDTLVGGRGHDIYLFGRGSGKDFVDENDIETSSDSRAVDSDSVMFGPDVSPDDLDVHRNDGSFALTIGIKGSGDTITFDAWYWSLKRTTINQFSFSTGAVLDATQIEARATEEVLHSSDHWSGTSFDDVLHGGTTSESLLGRGGNDLMSGNGGDDALNGGDGNDLIDGGAGNDGINGGEGDDTIIGGGGADTLEGGLGVNTFEFGRGDGHDYISSAGRATIRMGSDIRPADVSISRPGAQREIDLTLTDTEDHITLFVLTRDGNDLDVVFEDGTRWDLDYLRLQAGDLVTAAGVARFGSSHDDVITGGIVVPVSVYANGGDDFITGSIGDDHIFGGSGNDTVAADAGRDLIFGDEGADYLYGGDGDDQIYAGPGDDVIDGGSGDDLLWDQDGNDTYLFGHGYGHDVVERPISQSELLPRVETVRFRAGVRPTDVTVTTEAGFIVLLLSGGDDRIALNANNSVDRLLRAEFSDGTVWDLSPYADHRVAGTADNDILSAAGSSFRDVSLDGLGGNDILTGASGRDTLAGGAGDDTLDGGDGMDTYLFAPGLGHDVFKELQSNSRILFAEGISPDDVSFQPIVNLVFKSYASGDIKVSVGDAGDEILIKSGLSSLGGMSPSAGFTEIHFSDGTVWGPSQIDEHFNKEGTSDLDFLSGTSSDDVLDGLDGDDFLFGRGGNDTLFGGLGNDKVAGDEGDDFLHGGDGQDFIYGGAGNDHLTGGRGSDHLHGGPGDDQYRFDIGFGSDVIFEGSARFNFSPSLRESESIANGYDTVVFGAGITPGNVVVRADALNADAPNLYLSIAGTGDTITLHNWFSVYYKDMEGDVVEEVRFVDGTIWDAAELMIKALPATAGDDVYYGTNVADSFDGRSGDDVIFGGKGNDRLAGGPGQDHLYGGKGSDAYHFEVGDGVDFIVELPDYTDADTIEFGTGITSRSLSLDVGSLMIRMGNNGDAIHIEHFDPQDVYGSESIELFRFADGGQLTYAELLERGFDITGSNENDVLTGTNTSDRLSGLSGNDELNGGAGDDSLAGGMGSDRYRFGRGFGRDIVIESNAPAGDHDSVVLSDDVSVADLDVHRVMDDMVLSIRGTDDTLTMVNWFKSFDSRIELVSFGDGTRWNTDFIDSLVESVPVNHAPLVTHAISDQGAQEDTPFAFAVPHDNFHDPDGDALEYAALQSDGTPLPFWLNFDAAALTFTGTPGNDDVGGTIVSVVATDASGAFASTSFALFVTNTNDAPTLAHGIADQSANEDMAFSFGVPNDTFADADIGEILSSTAMREDGSALPAWMSFDGRSGMFTGTPLNDDVGVLGLRVVVSDTGHAIAEDVFSLLILNANDAPEARNDGVILSENATTYNLVPLLLANDTDVDLGDTLTITAVIISGALGTVAFDPSAQFLSYSASGAALDALAAEMTAVETITYTIADAAGASATGVVTITVMGVNDAPVLANVLADRTATQFTAFSYTVPAGTFTDVDTGDVLTYTATLASGAALPAWIAFNPSTRTFSGAPVDPGITALRVIATDSGNLRAIGEFNLSVARSTVGATLVGTSGGDKLIGGEGDDTLDGRGNADWLVGNSGNDTFQYFPDRVWAGFVARNDGSPGNPGTGKSTSISGKNRSYDVFEGGAGMDVIVATAGNDVLFLDDSYTATYGGVRVPRISGIERIDAGGGNDVVDLTSGTYAYGNITLDGGDGNDVLWTSAGDDALLGGSGNDDLYGGAGRDVVMGGSGNDTLDGSRGNDLIEGDDGNDLLTDRYGNNLLYAMNGNDSLAGGSGNELFMGGKGNDTIDTGVGSDVIAFNRGDDQDTVVASPGQDNTVSLGGGIRYSDMLLSKQGNSLVLETGANESITFKDWYSGTGNRSVFDLQVIAEAMSDFAPGGADPLRDNKVEHFDFRKIVQKFDQTRAASQGNAVRWAMMNALLDAHLAGSDGEALGGDLAYRYGLNASLSGIGANAAQDVLASPQFGMAAQALRPLSGLQDGILKLG